MQNRNKISLEKAVSESQKVVLEWGDVPSKANAKIHNHEAIMMFELLKQYGLENNKLLFKCVEIEQILTKLVNSCNPI